MATVTVLTLVTGLATALPAHAQRIRSGDVVTGVQFQGYDFEDRLGVEAANLVLVPLGYQVSVGSRLGLDLYTAYARGSALIGGTEFTLSGPVDTRIRANYEAAPWAVLTLGMNVPTGVSAHTEDEARVAAVLATDLLGFREANLGLGFGATTGIATAYRVNETGIGLGVSYRHASGFEPSADTALTYTPGNEVRVRLGLDRTIGAAKLTAGVTWQNFSEDQLEGRNLFQAGNRWRGDVSYSFRSGANATWTAYVTDVWRDHGDLRLDALGTGGATSRTGTQNLLLGGITGSWRVRPALTIRPHADFRMLSRQDPGGDGWLAGIGAAVPLQLGRFGITPGASLNYGRIEGDQAVGRRIWGGELSVTAAWGPG